MPNKLERIKVSGFKSIRELDIELRDLNVLIGANGSGKSNFMSLFEFLNNILENRLQIFTAKVGAEKLLYYGRKTTPIMGISLDFEGSKSNLINRYLINFTPTDNETLVFDKEIFFETERDAEDKNWAIVSGSSGHTESVLNEISQDGENYDIVKSIIQTMKNWKIYHFHDTGSTSPMKSYQNLHDNHYLKPDASNIASYLYWLKLKYPKYYQRIVKTIRFVTPFLDDFVLEPMKLNEERIRLEWRDKQSADTIFTAHDLSDGTLRFICLATLLLQPNLPQLILIDEPELGLHPFAIRHLAELLESVATKTQVIITTQSTTLVNQFAPEDIIVVDRKDGQSTFERIDTSKLEHWLEDYGVGDLWEKNVIDGTPQQKISVL